MSTNDCTKKLKYLNTPRSPKFKHRTIVTHQNAFLPRSSEYLNKIPANLLKIDKSFIDKINANESSKQYVAAIISMGHIMGLDVISEGVEEETQIEALRSIGCDYVQGYIWGRPMSAEDAEKLVTGIT